MNGFAREQHCWHGNGDWDAECCLCADNSCKDVTTIQALWHLSIERERFAKDRDRFTRTWGVRDKDGIVAKASSHAEAVDMQGPHWELVYRDCSEWEETPW